MNGQRYDYFLRQAANGWIVKLGYGPLGVIEQEFVFPTLDAMNEWLKSRHEETEAA